MSPNDRSQSPTHQNSSDLRQLAKKYRHIREDIQPIIDQLADGGKPGDRITGVKHMVFKVRARNSDARRGKSGGYRVIYRLRDDQAIILITIYSKSDQADVPVAEIRRIIAAQEASEADQPRDQD